MALSLTPALAQHAAAPPRLCQAQARSLPRDCRQLSWKTGLAAAALAAALPQRRGRPGSSVARRARLEKFVIRDAKYPDETPNEGDLVRIHYMGKLSDGTCFDNSRTRGVPFEFVLGESDVIDGWEALIPTMALEEKAELVCPPEYAYGEEGVEGIIPPNETLTFRVELLEIGRPVQDEKEKDVVDVSSDAEEDEEDANFWDKDGKPNKAGSCFPSLLEDEQRESGRGASFTWEASGSGKEILIRIPLDDDVRVKQIKFNVTSTSLMCKIADKIIVDGTLFAQVLTDDSFWDFEKRDGKAYLLITLGKTDPSIKWDSSLGAMRPHKQLRVRRRQHEGSTRPRSISPRPGGHALVHCACGDVEPNDARHGGMGAVRCYSWIPAGQTSPNAWKIDAAPSQTEVLMKPFPRRYVGSRLRLLWCAPPW
eukprot:s1868_g16.t1